LRLNPNQCDKKGRRQVVPPGPTAVSLSKVTGGRLTGSLGPSRPVHQRVVSGGEFFGSQSLRNGALP